MYGCAAVVHHLMSLHAPAAVVALHHPHPHLPFPPTIRNSSFLNRRSRALIPSPNLILLFKLGSSSNPSITASSSSFDEDDDDDDDYSQNLLFDDDDEDEDDDDSRAQSVSVDGVDVEIEKVGKNCRRIRSRVAVESDLHTIWNVLTDYERLADFIPGLVVSRLIEKRDNFARLFQVGQQDLTFGLKFNAKGTLDCYEKAIECLPHGQKRDIEFKMIEGDFQIFEGKWSIEQNTGRCEDKGSSMGEEFHSYLSYVVDVKPKLWLPVDFVEGRLVREIKLNLLCICEKAKNAAVRSTLYTH